MLRSSFRWRCPLCLVAILLLALGVRWFDLSRNSLWIDEYLSLECSSGWARTDAKLAGSAEAVPDLITLGNAKPLATIWSSIGSDENHPPLYFILLRLWRDAFGDSPAALRSLSVAASLVALIFIFAIGVTLHSPRAGLWACLLMALAAPQIQQSQDARAYMLVTAATMAAGLAMVRIDRLGPSILRCLMLFLTALFALFLHYMAFASLAALLIYAIAVMRGESRKWAIISMAMCLTVYAFLWGPQMVQQHYRMLDDTAWLVDSEPMHAASVVEDLCSVPARWFLDLELTRIPIAWLGAPALIVPLLLSWKYRQARLCWIWMIVPIVIALSIDCVSQRRTLSMIRYLLAAAPGMYLMLGILAAQQRRLGWIPATVIVVCCAICLPSIYESHLPDYREVSRFIASSSKPTDPVLFVTSHPDIYWGQGMLSASYYLADQKHPMYVVDRAIPPSLLTKLQGARHICVIADSASALNRPLIPGLAIDRGDILVGIAVVGTADPIAQQTQMSRAKFNTNPALRVALGMR